MEDPLLKKIEAIAIQHFLKEYNLDISTKEKRIHLPNQIKKAIFDFLTLAYMSYEPPIQEI